MLRLQIKIELMKSYLTLVLILAPASILGGQSFRYPNPAPSVYWKDVDGDRKPDKFLYQIKWWEKDYEGGFRIVSAQGRVLWRHEYPIAKKDLHELLATEGAVTGKKVTLADWVRRFFSGKLNYGARIERIKIQTEDIDAEQLDHAAKLAGISSRSLETEILAQETNLVVSYRAEWREDLMSIVYIPSLKKFVCHSRGY